MQPDVHVHPPAARVFQYSLDWRFLLPVADPAKIRLAFEEDADFGASLVQAGMPVSNQLFASGFTEEERSNTHSLVLPFGLPVRQVSAQPEEQIEFYRSIRRMIHPGGYFLLGFRNSRISRSDARYHASTPPRVADQLSRAGFSSIKIFGAMPDLLVPEYIFELNAWALNFALQHRFRRKAVLLNMLHILARTVGLVRISNFLPCYFALATA